MNSYRNLGTIEEVNYQKEETDRRGDCEQIQMQGEQGASFQNPVVVDTDDENDFDLDNYMHDFIGPKISIINSHSPQVPLVKKSVGDTPQNFRKKTLKQLRASQFEML